jgi:hypothetical protein
MRGGRGVAACGIERCGNSPVSQYGRHQRARVACRPFADVDRVEEVGEVRVEGARVLRVDAAAGAEAGGIAADSLAPR